MIADQANVEHFYLLLYNCLRGACYGTTPDVTALIALLAGLWLWVVIVGYVLAVLALAVIIYCTVRLFEIRKKEDEFYGALLLAPEANEENPRWKHIESLIAGQTPSEWREAIMEADIMLDDILSRQGYIGESVGERLRQVEPADFSTLQDAWEAHKVRNQIAHEGSSFDLSETLANRTIQRYEAVFREFQGI